jgi:hypothetical protein
MLENIPFEINLGVLIPSKTVQQSQVSFNIKNPTPLSFSIRCWLFSKRSPFQISHHDFKIGAGEQEVIQISFDCGKLVTLPENKVFENKFLLEVSNGEFIWRKIKLELRPSILPVSQTTSPTSFTKNKVKKCPAKKALDPIPLKDSEVSSAQESGGTKPFPELLKISVRIICICISVRLSFTVFILIDMIFETFGTIPI